MSAEIEVRVFSRHFGPVGGAARMAALVAVLVAGVAPPAVRADGKPSATSGPVRHGVDCGILNDSHTMQVISGGLEAGIRRICSKEGRRAHHRLKVEHRRARRGLPRPVAETGSVTVNNPTGDPYPFITQNDPAAAVSPTTGTMLVAYRDTSTFAGVAWSTSSSGTSWFEHGGLPEPSGGNVVDTPAATADRFGTFYVASVDTNSGGPFIGVSRSTNDGSSFSTPVVVAQKQTGEAHPTALFDWPGLGTDTTTGAHSGRVYACFARFYHDFTLPTLEMSSSDDRGVTWTPPRIVGSGPGINGCAVAVNGSGTVVIAWYSYDSRQVQAAYSTDGGQNWSGTLGIASAFHSQWDFDCDRPALHGQVRQEPWPSLVADSTYFYIVFSTWSNASESPGRSDIKFIRSSTGSSWSSPVMINDDTAGDKWLPHVAVSSGEVRVIWYDRRNSADNSAYDVYTDRSTSQGSSWSGNRRITPTAMPLPQLAPNFDCGIVPPCFFGDRLGLAAVSSSSFLSAWGDTRTSKSGTSCGSGRPSSSPDPDVRALVGTFSACDNCDDGDPCTVDTCNASGGCVHTPGNNGAACDDNNACTINDVCSSGTCAGTARNCDDGVLCTTDSCNTSTGCVHVNNTVACDDGNPCTTNDVCGGGTCHGGPQINCNDGNSCTSDSCNPATGLCVHADLGNGTACSDGNACTSGDRCTGGFCVPGSSITCNDGDGCTVDSCDPVFGCLHPPVNCDDGNGCTADSCSAGACVHTPISCDDGNACTIDTCSAGMCQHSCSNGSACGAPCNGTCSQSSGTCRCQ